MMDNSSGQKWLGRFMETCWRRARNNVFITLFVPATLAVVTQDSSLTVVLASLIASGSLVATAQMVKFWKNEWPKVYAT
jgi:hypothetical protein